MSELPHRPQWPGYLAIGLLVLVLGLVVKMGQEEAIKGIDITHFVVHLKDPSCQLRGYLMLNSHTSANFDSGDETQQRLWALAEACHGWIEMEKPKHSDAPYIPQGPSRTG